MRRFISRKRQRQRRRQRQRQRQGKRMEAEPESRQASGRGHGCGNIFVAYCKARYTSLACVNLTAQDLFNFRFRQQRQTKGGVSENLGPRQRQHRLAVSVPVVSASVSVCV